MNRPCSTLCRTCCSEINLSGFDHPVFPQMYAFTNGLTEGGFGGSKLSRFTLRTERHFLPDGRIMWVRLDVFKFANGRSGAHLVVTVLTPESIVFQLQTTPVTNTSFPVGRYTQEDFHYRYQHPEGQVAINNACSRQGLVFLPEHITAIRKTTGTVTNPQNNGPSTALQQDILMLQNTSSTTPSLPPGPDLELTPGTVAVQLGIHSRWSTFNSHSQAVFVEGDKWLHNTDEVIVEIGGEIVGEQDTLTYYDRDNQEFIELPVMPASYTLSCLAAGGYTPGQTDRTYRFEGTVVLPSGDESATVRLDVSLRRNPSCRFGGELQARITRNDLGGVPVAQVVGLSDLTPLSFDAGLITARQVNPLSSFGSQNQGVKFFHETRQFSSPPDFSTSNNNVFTTALDGRAIDWYTPAFGYYRDRLRRCDNPPCVPEDEGVEPDNFARIALPEGGSALTPEQAFPDFYLFRIHAYRIEPDPDLPGFDRGVLDIDNFVRVRFRARIVGLQ